MAPDLRSLTTEDILRIHDMLVADFAASADPISPAGLRSRNLLESAVARQWTGHSGVLKYPTAIENAATLAFGICCNHPFHNGNKRIALVSMLAHLDRNKRTLYEVNQADLYRIFLRLADRTLSVRLDPRRPDKRPRAGDADDEVGALAEWLRRHVKEVVRGERRITYRELKRVLGRHGYQVMTPADNHVDVVRLRSERVGPFFNRRTRTVTERVARIGWPDGGRIVSMRDLKLVRRMCRLTEEDGVDSSAFYDDEAVVDGFINHYRTILRRLAKT